MPQSTVSHFVAPSPTLLRFLRSQVEPCRRTTWSTTPCAGLLRQSRCVHSASKHPLKLLAAPQRHSPTAVASRLRLHESTVSPASPIFGEHNAPLRRRRNSFGDGNPSSLRRWFSSQQHSSWWWRWWKGATTPRGRQLPPLASFLDASSSTARSVKAANEPRLRCTEFDENGNVTLVNGEFKKSELIAKVGGIPFLNR
jgi:magnesium transporter